VYLLDEEVTLVYFDKHLSNIVTVGDILGYEKYSCDIKQGQRTSRISTSLGMFCSEKQQFSV
jgi:hypothetical protein